MAKKQTTVLKRHRENKFWFNTIWFDLILFDLISILQKQNNSITATVQSYGICTLIKKVIQLDTVQKKNSNKYFYSLKHWNTCLQ